MCRVATESREGRAAGRCPAPRTSDALAFSPRRSGLRRGSARTAVARDVHEVDVETLHQSHVAPSLLRLPGASSRRAWSTPGAPRRGGGLPASKPGLVAGAHDRAITVGQRKRARQRDAAGAGDSPGSRKDRGQGRGLGLLALKQVYLQREPGAGDEQADGDLRGRPIVPCSSRPFARCLPGPSRRAAWITSQSSTTKAPSRLAWA